MYGEGYFIEFFCEHICKAERLSVSIDAAM